MLNGQSLTVLHLIFCVGAISFGAASGHGVEASYEVKGSVTFTESAVSDRAKIYDFYLVVCGEKWYIKTTDRVFEIYDYKEVAFDGREICFLANGKSAMERINAEARRKGESTVSNEGGAWIYEDVTFHNVFAHEVTPVWLAFASHRYLNSRTNSAIKPASVFLGGEIYLFENQFLMKASWNVNNNSPGLPSTVVIYDDGYLHHPKNKDIKIRREPPFDQGFTNQLYAVHSWTNIGGLELPFNAALVVLTPNTETNRSNTYEFCRYSITMENARRIECDGISFKPSLTGTTLVTEARFKEAGTWNYEILSKRWPSKDAVKSSSGYRDALRDNKERELSAAYGTTNRRAGRMSIVLSLVCISTAVLIVILLTNKNRKT